MENKRRKPKERGMRKQGTEVDRLPSHMFFLYKLGEKKVNKLSSPVQSWECIYIGKSRVLSNVYTNL